MKKDIAWLKKEIERLSYTPKGLDDSNAVISTNWILNFIDQLDEPVKPVIPQFVADYYNDYKNYELTFAEWFECPVFGKEGKTEDKTFEWLLDNSHEVNIERQFILADIIAHGLDGYEVEKEILWEIPMPDLKTTGGHIQYLTYDPKARTYFAASKNERLKQTFNTKDFASVPEQYRRYAELCDFKKIEGVEE